MALGLPARPHWGVSRCSRWGRPSPCRGPRGPFQGLRPPQCPPAGLVLQSLVPGLVDARQGHTISSLLLLSPAESPIQVCRPLLSNGYRGREIRNFICLRPHQSKTPASEPVACPAQLVASTLAASALPCYPADPGLMTPTTDPSSLCKVWTPQGAWRSAPGPACRDRWMIRRLEPTLGDPAFQSQGASPSNPCPCGTQLPDPLRPAAAARGLARFPRASKGDRAHPPRGLAFSAEDSLIHALNRQQGKRAGHGGLSKPAVWEMGPGCKQNQGPRGAPASLQGQPSHSSLQGAVPFPAQNVLPHLSSVLGAS